MTAPPTLDLNELAIGNFPAVTPALGSALAEAGAVCLEGQDHSQGVQLTVRGISSIRYSLTWQSVTPQAKRSWNDRAEAAEKGAEGIAILITKRAIGYEVIRRSRQGAGFDFWIGSQTDTGFLAQAGLEISGILRGTDGTVRARVREKLQQVDQSGGQQWEAYVIVVEFGRPLAEIQKND